MCVCIKGPPGAPTILGISDVDKGTITLIWHEGSHGGYDQIVHFQTSSNDLVWTVKMTITVFANEPTVLRNTTITDLAGSNVYLRLFASNFLGISETSAVWNTTIQGISSPKNNNTYIHI